MRTLNLDFLDILPERTWNLDFSKLILQAINFDFFKMSMTLQAINLGLGIRLIFGIYFLRSLKASK